MSGKREREEELSEPEAKKPRGDLDQVLPDLVSEKLTATRAIKDEQNGSVDFRVVDNDGSDVSMILLTGLKNIFQKQLPNMPREYIARLVYDTKHQSMAVVRYPLQVMGGITYRAFPTKDFAEIVFCAISSTEQVQGYGSRLMSHVKDYVRSTYNIRHFLTYADNYAIGYFKKQGFTTEIALDKSQWMGYIKDYEGGTLMECSMVDRVKYLDVVNIISAQRYAVFQKIREATNSEKIYPGLKVPKSQLPISPQHIPGVIEAGWTPETEKSSQKLMPRQRGPLYMFMKKVVSELQDNNNSWPFAAPVSGVQDYYDVIKEPMDLKTLDENVEADKYQTSDQFYKDVNLIFTNCRTYNADGSAYVKCANRLEKWFKERYKILKIEMAII